MQAIVRRGRPCLFALLLLTACASDPEVIYRTETREVPVPQYRELPEELTAPAVLPPWPDRALTNADLANWIEATKAVVKTVNARLERVRELQGEQP